MKRLATNPHLESIFKRMIKAGIQEETQSLQLSRPGLNKSSETLNKQIEFNKTSTPVKEAGMNNRGTNVMKSPSDTTLYAPALKRVDGSILNDKLIDKISNFIEGIRMEAEHKQQTRSPVSRRESDRPSTSNAPPLEQEAKKEKTRNFIVQAEQFKASIDPPKGKEFENFFQQCLDQMNAENDDDFFQLTCHVDATMRAKIERGDFIKLDKLLPKRRHLSSAAPDNRRLEWISREGMTFLAPVPDKEARITGIKKWDQAFRIFAAIFCKANPQRAAEILQYIYVIHSAAITYQWDNIAQYDFVFRQLMAEKPHRNWGKIYSQSWQLSLRDPLTKNGNGWYQNHSNHSYGEGLSGRNFSNNNSSGKHKHRNWRDNCCWRYNRTGKCDREGCEFDNRCSYCGIWNSHGANSCRKKAASRILRLAVRKIEKINDVRRPTNEMFS